MTDGESAITGKLILPPGLQIPNCRLPLTLGQWSSASEAENCVEYDGLFLYHYQCHVLGLPELEINC